MFILILIPPLRKVEPNLQPLRNQPLEKVEPNLQPFKKVEPNLQPFKKVEPNPLKNTLSNIKLYWI